MRKPGNARWLGMVAATAIAGMASSALAQEVTLRSSDGTVNMTGELLSFENNTYTIQTLLGPLRVQANRVICSGDACPDLSVAEVDLAISGSEEIGAGLMPLLVEGFAGSKDAAADIGNTAVPGQFVAKLVADQGFGDDLANIQVTGSSASAGVADLLSGESDVAMTSRRLVAQEVSALRDVGAGDMLSPSQEHILAVDSLIVVVHPDNPIGTLDVRQLFGIYSGAVSNWAQLGGPDLPVQVVLRNIVGSNRQDAFESSFFGSADISLTPSAEIVPSSNAVAQFVNENPGAIGVVGYAFQRGANTINIVNQCGITMVPDAFSAQTEEYALQRRLYLYTRGDTDNENVSDFVNYATSDEVDGVLRKAGFIGFRVNRKEQSPTDLRGAALRNTPGGQLEQQTAQRMLGQMRDFDRLSTTFRFRTGSSELDERANVDKERLISYLAEQPAGTEVLFVGFTDSVGRFDSNLNLAERRAAQVAAEVVATAGNQLSGVSLRSVGYGEVAPSGCNETDQGRRINRRVEVWINSPT
ncbi:phosphate ABC transporter substrate-binding/OmpA family protein [Cognatiyoonia sp. IB215182]|uniref:phosphate ABC transporter substrate-binding/OmpA family protein n=1 Tax=Cognatiyoonia sp. IB215182 TaxID=3097353 RepID=UPI002A0BFD3B|nr:phosphate ABC transporter substrate-binding/OmpA family protein [Cognatiyoonia sp. IB215182]MDX8352346.1 phosphate ABC transporter substrate-binding/OmpA family protein [Cognatiyoonia sp. IB215182]